MSFAAATPEGANINIPVTFIEAGNGGSAAVKKFSLTSLLMELMMQEEGFKHKMGYRLIGYEKKEYEERRKIEISAWEHYWDYYPSMPKVTKALEEHGFENPLITIDPENKLKNWANNYVKNMESQTDKSLEDKLDVIVCGLMLDLPESKIMESMTEDILEDSFYLCSAFIVMARAAGFKAGMVFSGDKANCWVELHGDKFMFDPIIPRNEYKEFKRSTTFHVDYTLINKYKLLRTHLPHVQGNKLVGEPAPAAQIFAESERILASQLFKMGDMFSAESSFLNAADIFPCDDDINTMQNFVKTLLDESNIVLLAEALMNGRLTYEDGNGLLLKKLIDEHTMVALAMKKAETILKERQKNAPQVSLDLKMDSPILKDKERTAWGEYNKELSGMTDFPAAMKKFGLSYPFEDDNNGLRDLARKAVEGISDENDRVKAIISALVPALYDASSSRQKDSLNDRCRMLYISCMFITAARSVGIEAGVISGAMNISQSADTKGFYFPDAVNWVKVGKIYYGFTFNEYNSPDLSKHAPLTRIPILSECDPATAALETSQSFFAYYHYCLFLNSMADIYTTPKLETEKKETMASNAESYLVKAAKIHPEQPYYRQLLDKLARDHFKEASIDPDELLRKTSIADISQQRNIAAWRLMIDYPSVYFFLDVHSKPAPNKKGSITKGRS